MVKIDNKGVTLLELLVCMIIIGIIACPLYTLIFRSIATTQQLNSSTSNAQVLLNQLNTAIIQAQGAAASCQSSCQQPSPSPSPVKENDPCDH